MTDTLEKAQQEGRAPWTDIFLDTREFVVYNDLYPVTDGHTLVVPKENTIENIQKCFKFAQEMGNMNIEAETNPITGYNIGINMGTSAGQTCMYPHVHLIFRRDGDMEDPAGGVRGVIPEKQKYIKKDNNQMDIIDMLNGENNGC
jgi:diadenosine tetraphosphate (Ap4A) HIT family hydrolase